MRGLVEGAPSAKETACVGGLKRKERRQFRVEALQSVRSPPATAMLPRKPSILEQNVGDLSRRGRAEMCEGEGRVANVIK